MAELSLAAVTTMGGACTGRGPGGPQPVRVRLHGGGIVGRGAVGGLAAGEVAGLAVGDEPVRAVRGQVRLAVVAGVGGQDADPAGHGGMAGGDVVAGIVFAPLGEGAYPVVAFREHGRVGGVGGVAGRDDRGALLRHPGKWLCLQHVAGVLAGVAAGHEPVIGRGVLAVAAMDEPAAADRQQPGVRVGDVAPRRLRAFVLVPGISCLPGFRGGPGLQCVQAGAGPAGLLASAGPGRRAGDPLPGGAAGLPVRERGLLRGDGLLQPQAAAGV